MAVTAWIALLVIAGVGVAILNYRYMADFERYCVAVATEKNELHLLASPYGGPDGGLNGYRTQIDDGLAEDDFERGLSAGLQQWGRLLDARRARMYQASIAFVLTLIGSGLVLGW